MGEGINEQFGINTYTLPDTKQIINKDPLDSTGSSTLGSVTTWIGRVWKRMDICVTESLCCATETHTHTHTHTEFTTL